MALCPFKFTRIGRWWSKHEEVDIVALSEKDKKMLVCEVEWRRRKMGTKDLESLIEKAHAINWKTPCEKYYCLINKSGFQEKLEYEEEPRLKYVVCWHGIYVELVSLTLFLGFKFGKKPHKAPLFGG